MKTTEEKNPTNKKAIPRRAKNVSLRGVAYMWNHHSKVWINPTSISSKILHLINGFSNWICSLDIDIDIDIDTDCMYVTYILHINVYINAYQGS